MNYIVTYAYRDAGAERGYSIAGFVAEVTSLEDAESLLADNAHLRKNKKLFMLVFEEKEYGRIVAFSRGLVKGGIGTVTREGMQRTLHRQSQKSKLDYRSLGLSVNMANALSDACDSQSIFSLLEIISNPKELFAVAFQIVRDGTQRHHFPAKDFLDALGARGPQSDIDRHVGDMALVFHDKTHPMNPLYVACLRLFLKLPKTAMQFVLDYEVKIAKRDGADNETARFEQTKIMKERILSLISLPQIIFEMIIAQPDKA